LGRPALVDAGRDGELTGGALAFAVLSEETNVSAHEETIQLKLHTRGRIAGELSVQLVSAAVSAASNLEESDDASSDRDL
jgi:hypothetical protein